jgi:isocitrate dehydrogenase
MNGGGLFETGAGGSAPKHIQQFIKEGHLRWDSLGEFMAIAASLEHLSEKNNNPQAKVLANCLDLAIEKLLKNGKSPKRKIGELDNRGSHFYLALFWAEELAKQSDDEFLKSEFELIYQKLKAKESDIISELSTSNLGATEIDGYYYPDSDAITKSMRPSSSFNAIIN